MVSPYLERPLRTIEQIRDDLVARLDQMALTDPRRGEVVHQIVILESEINIRQQNTTEAAPK